MASKKLKITLYKIKRFLFLLILLSILAFVYWIILKKVSPVFKPPEENKAPVQRDHRGVLNIKALVDYKNPADSLPKEQTPGEKSPDNSND